MYRMWQSCKCVLVTAPRRRLQMFTLMHSKLIGAQCPVWSGSPMIKWSVKNPFFFFFLCVLGEHIFRGFTEQLVFIGHSHGNVWKSLAWKTAVQLQIRSLLRPITAGFPHRNVQLIERWQKPFREFKMSSLWKKKNKPQIFFLFWHRCADMQVRMPSEAQERVKFYCHFKYKCVNISLD